MEGQPAQFESIGNRLGFRVVEENRRWLKLAWQGPRFPAFLCLGIALLLLFVSVPIIQALRWRGFVGPAGSLWYFPLMNLILLGISLYLISQKRTVVIDSAAQTVTLRRRGLHRQNVLALSYSEIDKLELSLDQVYSGFAVAGSSAAQSFPVPSLRLIASNGESILIDRGSKSKLAELGKSISERLMKPLAVDPAVTMQPRAPGSRNFTDQENRSNRGTGLTAGEVD
jgi:hypothetical protein